MFWNLRYRVAGTLRSSLWVIPLAAVLLEQMVAWFVFRLDERSSWGGLGLGPEGARAMAGAVISLTLSFLVFTFGSLLVAIQVASGQYTPRIIATTLLRDNVIRYTVGLQVFTLLFAVKALDHTEDSVPQLVTFTTAILGLICIASFLYLIDHAARLLRPVSLVRNVGESGLTVMRSVYPEQAGHFAPPPDSASFGKTGMKPVFHDHTSSMVLAVDVSRLIAEAERAGGIIEIAPQVGDLVGSGEPLFYLHSGAVSIDDKTLRAAIAFGTERTMEQDPLFALRILVDIAIKALSKAINDPTTAVLAIDQIQRLLKSAGRRNLRTDFLAGPQGHLRVILRTPDWEDFVHLALSEIRYYGAENIQVARRLRAMLMNLVDTLPGDRHPALQTELKLLDHTIEKLYTMPEDLALARMPDPQGLGGSTGRRAPPWRQSLGTNTHTPP